MNPRLVTTCAAARAPRAPGTRPALRGGHLRVLATLALVLVAGVGGAAPKPDESPRLVDLIEAPGTRVAFKPFMLHADLWVGLDQRARLDSIVFVLENGARCCQVMNADSTWAVDYTWIYPHNLLPSRWYDPQELFRVGDSLGLREDAELKLTFGTCRMGVHAGSLAQAHEQAIEHWPVTMPEALRGRLRLKVERAGKALRGDKDTEPHVGN
jgi:hypothetical protein